MTILHPTKLRGTVLELLKNGDENDESIATAQTDRFEMRFGGIVGDRHFGITSESDVRYRKQYENETEIRNTRQVTIICREEMADVATALGIEKVAPEWLGANMLVAGIADFTLLPPSTRLIFSSGAALVVDNENEPCRYPADLIAENNPNHKGRFVEAAKHKRGVVAWVEREGEIAVGDEIAVHLPPVRLYPHG